MSAVSPARDDAALLAEYEGSAALLEAAECGSKEAEVEIEAAQDEVQDAYRNLSSAEYDAKLARQALDVARTEHARLEALVDSIGLREWSPVELEAAGQMSFGTLA